MASVKSISIRKSVKSALKYIVDPKKTEGYLLVEGVNCSTDYSLASVQFNTVQKMYAKDTYKNASIKKPIIAHHFVQSFKKGEIKNPELALKIAKETVSKHFGNNFQAVLATHVNTESIHTHIIINSIDMEGNKYHANKKSLRQCRSISDEICKENNLSIIQNNNLGVTYGKWKPKTQNVFWKDKLKLAIDKAIINSSDIKEFIKEIAKYKCNAKLMYNAKGEQYLGIKEGKSKWHMNTTNLGEEYTLEKIIYRVENKEQETPIFESNKYVVQQEIVNKNTFQNKYKGIPLKYVSTMKLIARLIDDGKIKSNIKFNTNEPYSKQNDYNIKLLSDQLSYLSKNNIVSEEDLSSKYNNIKQNLINAKDEINKLNKTQSDLKTILESVERYNFLRNKSNLTTSEKAVLRSAEKVIQKYKIDTSKHELIINKSKDLSVKINDLKPKLNTLGEEFNVINSINNTYSRIKDESYIKEVTKVREKDKDKEERKPNQDYER